MRYLYLGNNSLSGKLQLEEWLSKIDFVDLSYNKFTGDFPSWYLKSISNKKKLNLVGNSFNTNPTSESNIEYLQKGFRCDSKYQKNLAIDCGGEGWNDSDLSIHYEADEKSLGASSFYVHTNKNWAVSNTGNFMDNASQTELQKDTEKMTGVYRTARLSSTSLRYYGLCLPNGQYTVQLQFAEIVFTNENSYRSLGRRIFDVYIQGTKMLPNFNIAEVAGGAFKEVVRKFTVNVTDNTLEIHFLWAGKGTYNVPEEGTYGPSVSAIVITPDFTVNGRNKTPVIVGIVLGAVISLALAAFLSFMFIKKRKGIRNSLPDDNREMKTISNSFSLEEIRSATNDFQSENKIGEGGFGAVFKGVLPEGRMVAVKQLFSKSRQGNREFLNEVATISAVQHPNLVKLYGSCIEGKQLLLVYEYLENNDLARALFGPKEFQIYFNWPARHKICLGVARGLAYLHEESRLRIVHRDIKAANILLDQDLNPKISDFGLAKLFDQEKTHVSTRVAGTIGYMAPEYALRGHLTEKADVYSFGVVLLEIVSGRPHMDRKLQGEKVYLMEWAWTLYGENKLLDIVDVNLRSSSFPEEEILRTLNVGLLCIQANPTLRPAMSTIVNMLEGKIDVPVSGCQPPYLSYGQTHAITEEQPLSQSMSLEGPWKGSSSSQGISSVNQQQKAENDDNEENSLLSSQVSADP
ncbi:probable LRR receptor-like serine/threonine-protein kinase At1g53440 isoform X1 [Cryptomeria japonica]|uniref:probable LRR receptor-like serine/threonine-protein kinase At1g53440 isoform X1 n=2 Tax=Cryptomeria japonica TaxID=3369 RepID=UPI0025AC4C02|nr:probable LRR receptor-like serine/threonine-protein kinase At1g53440 isoform X1 [Cryptomeria japonica]